MLSLYLVANVFISWKFDVLSNTTLSSLVQSNMKVPKTNNIHRNILHDNDNNNNKNNTYNCDKTTERRRDAVVNFIYGTVVTDYFPTTYFQYQDHLVFCDNHL